MFRENRIKEITVCSIFLLLQFYSSEEIRGQQNLEYTPLSSEEIPEVLLMLSGKMKNNIGRIKVWQGTATLNGRSLHYDQKAVELSKKFPIPNCPNLGRLKTVFAIGFTASLTELLLCLIRAKKLAIR